MIGEEPYAEWFGDIQQLEYQHGDKRDLALIKQLKQQGIPVVTVFLTGRPLWTNKEINASDAFVVAWLPGSEGQGWRICCCQMPKAKPVMIFRAN